jgi:MatE
VADAAEVRTAYLLGAGEPEKAKKSAYKAVFLAIFAAVFITSLLFIGGEDIPTWLTTDPTLQRLTADLLPLFGLGNIALTIGTMAWTIVGAQGRYRLSTGIGFGGSWLISIPLAAFLSIYMKFDLKGQTAAIVVGYMVSGTINSYILLQSDWPKLSRRVIARAAEAGDYDDSDDDDSSSSSSSDEDDDEDSSGAPAAVLDRPKSTPTTSTSATITTQERNNNPSSSLGVQNMEAPTSKMDSWSRSFQSMFTTGKATEDTKKASSKA